VRYQSVTPFPLLRSGTRTAVRRGERIMDNVAIA
jgi:hypothetical protein